MIQFYEHLVKHKIEIFTLEKGYFVAVHKPTSMADQMKPMIDIMREMKNDGDEWKNKEEEKEDPNNPGLYLFHDSGELIAFLTDRLV